MPPQNASKPRHTWVTPNGFYWRARGAEALGSGRSLLAAAASARPSGGKQPAGGPGVDVHGGSIQLSCSGFQFQGPEDSAQLLGGQSH